MFRSGCMAEVLNFSKHPLLCTLKCKKEHINSFVSVNKLIQVHSLSRRLVKPPVCIFEEMLKCLPCL